MQRDEPGMLQLPVTRRDSSTGPASCTILEVLKAWRILCRSGVSVGAVIATLAQRARAREETRMMKWNWVK